MDFLLQINDIVSGPIKDLMVHFSTGQPEINLPQINMPAPPENVSVDFSPTTSFSNEFSPSIEKTEPSNFLNDLSLPDINVSAI
ncbi:hypothetical protein I6J22_09055 [Corynebacterium kroppenstedtii]|uniref:Uncharacterized protein n=1 Tax=Corynebacterium kroppenstedtii (strain DSM 44385 / JCM 11950 / CIP 105744 / CCUG 35717) TaxID=645127 RepID=C4LKG9_CORK4|nr:MULTISPECIES: hypothetical protein [Corynebacterium]ACR18324.1 hypothetical protein ckrop_1595 [Corynebacterium kroppenstedtii DSM 44385]MDN8624594.1 hypothetical protein [Corynebacterium kroppenstedtii]QRP10334.1 hypothetical protein I6J22_09055 [Corynebacterium kroppenstedtii]